MKDFKDIKSNIKTTRESTLDFLVSKTGLDTKQVELLYDKIYAKNQGNNDKIKKDIDTLISVDMPIIDDFVSVMNSEDFEGDTNSDITNKIINRLNDFSKKTDDYSLLIAIIDVLSNFTNIEEKINLKALGINKPLMESQTIYEFNSSNNTRLFTSLRDILTRNNKRFGNNYHLKNAYNTIQEYLVMQSEEIANKDSIQYIQDKSVEIIMETLRDIKINPMYRSVDVLNKLVPDQQTFVFDLFILTESFLNHNEYYFDNINANIPQRQLHTSEKLYSQISQSHKTSAIVKKVSKKDYAKSLRRLCLVNFEIDDNKIPSQLIYNMQFKTVGDYLHIMKALSDNFNFKIRKIINNYVTATLELLIRAEKIYNKTLIKK